MMETSPDSLPYMELNSASRHPQSEEGCIPVAKQGAGSDSQTTTATAERLREQRVAQLTGRLRAVYPTDLPPDARTSLILALAHLLASAEIELAAERTSTLPAASRPAPLHPTAVGGVPAIRSQSEALDTDLHLLPAFIAEEQGRATAGNLPEIVNRFVRGARPNPAGGTGTSPSQRRRERLRALQRSGVDLSLIEATLAQTPGERIANMERQLQTVRQLQEAVRRRQRNTP